MDQKAWEYTSLIGPITVDEGEMNEFVKRLNQLGSEGWELCASYAWDIQVRIFILKRTRSS